MKFHNRIIAVILSIVLVLSSYSCAHTPSEDVIVNKGDGTLEDKIEHSNGFGLNMDTNTSKENNDSTLLYTFTNSSGNVAFHIDANVLYPNVDTFPVLKATTHFFTTDELELISNVLCKGNPIYEYSEVLTKSELETEILEHKQYISNRAHLEESFNGDIDTIDYVINLYQNRISAMEKAYLTAPIEPPIYTADFQYHDESYYHTSYDSSDGIDGILSFKATSTVNGVPMFIWSAQRNDSSYVLSNILAYVYDYRSPQLSTSDFYQKSQFSDNDLEEAFTIVKNTLSDMDLTDWGIRAYGLSDYSATIICTPEYYGIPMSADQNWGALSSNFYYNPSYTYPKIEITISNDQIIDFWFEGPLDVTEVLNQNVELLSYPEIVERIYTQLELSWTVDRIAEYLLSGLNVKAVSASFNISSIELTMVRVSIKNEPNNYYILPAWIVYGTPSLDEYILYGEKISESTSGGYSNIPILVINAIDGSVIDMSQGY